MERPGNPWRKAWQSVPPVGMIEMCDLTGDEPVLARVERIGNLTSIRTLNADGVHVRSRRYWRFKMGSA